MNMQSQNRHQFRSDEIRKSTVKLVDRPLSDHFLSEIEEQEIQTDPLYEIFMDDSDSIISQFNLDENLANMASKVQIPLPV